MIAPRYRLIALIAAPLGFVVGALAYLVVMIGDSEPFDLLISGSVFAAFIGAVVAIAALIGGLGLIRLKDPDLTAASSSRVGWGTLGSVAGTVVVLVIASIVGLFIIVLFFGVLIIVLAAGASAALIAFAERRAAAQ